MNQLAQVSQIQSSQRQGEMAQMQIQQMRRDETALTQFYADVAKNGGPTNPVEIEDAMIKSGVRDIVNSGLTARMTRSKLENQQKQFAGIMGARMPTGAPMAAPAAAAVPEPGSFGADVAARTAAIPAFARGGNALIPEQAPRVNALGGGGANNAAEIAFKQQQRDALIGMGTTQSIAAAKAIDADIALLAREPSYQNVPGVGLVDPRTGRVVMPSVESTDPVIKQYNLAVSQGFNGSILDYKEKIARAGRAQAQPPAPSIQTIADPTDPTKAIVIDTRTYRPGWGINSLGVFGNAPPAKTTQTIREEELKTAYNTNRILNSAVQINNVLKKTPSASRPGGLEASAMAIFGNAGVANLSRSEDRQIVAAAQSDIIDSLLYLATGAAYNKEQLAQQRQSYLPAFTDAPGTVVAKQDALRGLIDGAKVRSGRAWTPKMQAAVDSLTGGATAPSPTPAGAAYVETKTLPDGRVIGKKADGSLEVIK
jgi:hypothetical protein